MTSRGALLALLVLLGAGWGVTVPLAKIMVSGAYRQFGILFWELLTGAALLAVISVVRGKRLPLGRAQIRVYIVIALLGTVLPGAASYAAAVHLPAGILAILLSLVPMFAFPIALALGTDDFAWPRLGGLILGLLGVALIAAPEASLPDRAMLAFIPLALIGPVFYGLEGNVVARWGTAGLDPMQLLLGASLVGAVLSLPLALMLGQWFVPAPPFGAPDLALFMASVLHALVYAAYVWLIGRAGSVFAAQVAYLVTGFGVLWSMVLLRESYSGWVWAAMAVMLAGLFLVQPRRNSALVPPRPVAKDTG